MTDNLHPTSSSNGSAQNIPQSTGRSEVQITAELASCPNQQPELALEIQAAQILDSSDDCIKVLDLEGRLLLMNRRGQVLMGIQDIAPFLHTSWIDFWQGEDRQAAIEAIVQARAGKVCTFQGYCPTLSGDPKWWDSKVSPMRGADGQVERLLCISRDISERRRIEDKRKQAEEKLRESEERHRAIVNQAITGVAYTSLGGELTLVNQKYCDITGYSADELSQLRMHDITYPDDLPRNVELYNRMLAEGTPFEIEKRYIRKDGSIVWVNNYVSLICDREGKPQSAVAIVLDISKRKQAEAALREAQESLTIAVEAAQMGTWYVDLTKDFSLKRSLRQDQIFGYDTLPTEVGQSIAKRHVIEEDHEIFDAAFARAMKTGELAFEVRVQWSDDSIHWMAYRGRFYFDKQGNPTYGAGVNFDITESRQVEAQLRESEAKYRSLFNLMEEGYFLADVIFDENDQPIDIYYLEANPAAKRIAGRDFAGKHLKEVNPNYEAYWYEIPGRVAKTGKSERLEYYAEPDQKWYDFSIIKVGDKNSRQVAILFNDTTDRKRREANLAFLADIAEDFSHLSTATEIMQVVGAKLGAYLQITTCNFADVDEARGEVAAHYGWHSPDVPNTMGTFRIDEYLSEEFEQASRAGETVIVRDTQTDPRTDAPAYAALNIHSFVTVPFHGNGRWTHYIAVCDSRPRDWRDDEIELIEEVSNRIFPRLKRAYAEAALRQSEQRFRLMGDSVPHMVWITDAEGRVEFFNKQWSNYTGVFHEPTTAAEIAADFLYPDDSDRTLKAFDEARHNGSIFTVEHRVRSAAGVYRWFLVRAEPYRDPQTGEIIRWFGVSVDIHDRKRMEANLAFLAEIMADFAPLKTVTEIMHQTCIRTAAYFDLSRCLLVKISDAMDEAEVVYDFGAEGLPSIVGTYQIADFHTEDEVQALAAGQAIVVNDVAAVPRSPEAADRFAQLKIGALVNAPYVSGGQWKFVLSALQVEPRTWCSDEIELLQELAARVCLRMERAHAEAALRESEAKYRSLFESMDEGFCILQLIFDAEQKPIDYRYIETNPAFEQQTGIKNALGRTMRELVPNIEPFWFDIYGTVALTGKPTRFVDHAKSIGRWFDVNAFRVGEPHERRVAVLFNDISERKRAEAEREQLLANEQQARAAAEAAQEEAQAANRVKDEFLAVLSHELRSPLNPILGWSTLLLNKKLNEAKTTEALATIQRNAKLQSALIEDLLDVSRILRGKLSLNVAPVNLAATIRGAIETVQLAAEAKSITVEANFSPETGLVAGDCTRLQQVVWNLLSNAVKFTPEGGQVNIQLECCGSSAQITVSDTGQGIAPDFLPYVFDYFRQADAATTRKFGGLGLGLAIVRHLVELHGGTVSVDSPGVGQGATFTVQLPLMSAPSPTIQAAGLPQHSLNLNGIKVLVVDDETDTRELVSFVLEQQGAQVTTATSVHEALQVLPQAKPDLLLSDIGMPDLDGYVLIQQVRKLAPEQGGQIPAIALTAYAGDINQRQVVAAGFQKHISKPIEPEALIQEVLRLVQVT